MCRERRKKCSPPPDERGPCAACIRLGYDCPGGYGLPKPPGMKYLSAKERDSRRRPQQGNHGARACQGSPSCTTPGDPVVLSTTRVGPLHALPNLRPPSRPILQLSTPSIEVTAPSRPASTIPFQPFTPDGTPSPSTQFSLSCPPTPASTCSAPSMALTASPALSSTSGLSDLSGPPYMSNFESGEGHPDAAAVSLGRDTMAESSSSNPYFLFEGESGTQIYHPTSHQTSSAVSPRLQVPTLPVFSPQQNGSFEADPALPGLMSIMPTDPSKCQETAENGDQRSFHSVDASSTLSQWI
ncbi:hypothetical protein DL93DRAFT_404068 [Clavulina sp. PMI_390]|nr:hypothetical protein DL93DRAFT_404068 [Clavulina sp. PMI_390]